MDNSVHPVENMYSSSETQTKDLEKSFPEKSNFYTDNALKKVILSSILLLSLVLFFGRLFQIDTSILLMLLIHILLVNVLFNQLVLIIRYKRDVDFIQKDIRYKIDKASHTISLNKHNNCHKEYKNE